MRNQNRTKYKADRDKIIRDKFLQLHKQGYSNDFILSQLAKEYNRSIIRIRDIVKPRFVKRDLKQTENE